MKTAKAIQWRDLHPILDPALMCVPGTGTELRDPAAEHATQPLPLPGRHIITYLSNTMRDAPWRNHLALGMLVMSAHRVQDTTIINYLQVMHGRFVALAAAFAFTTVDDWDPASMLPSYIDGTVVPDDTLYLRMRFCDNYRALANHAETWFTTLPEEAKQRYNAWRLPALDPGLVPVTAIKRAVKTTQQHRRKQETDALLPHMGSIRHHATLRMNQMTRLRDAYHTALAQAGKEGRFFPVIVTYDEHIASNTDAQATPITFRIWDRRSFVLHEDHCHTYGAATLKQATEHKGSFSEERNILLGK